MRSRAAAALIATAMACGFSAIPARAQPQTAAPPASATGTLGLTGQDNSKPIAIEADNGIEWQQANRVYIARGHAKATRGDDTVTADTLFAYYRPTQPAQAQPAAPVLRGKPPAESSDPFANGSSQIYRIEADGNVVLTTPTQTAYGDHAVYDVDQAVMVLTGKALKIVTPQDTITARDSFEWYDQKQIDVARGDAVALRRLPVMKSMSGDVLTAFIEKPANQPAKIGKVDAQGHVILTSQDEIAHGDAGVYDLDTGIATLSGDVSLTRGENELRGQYGVVDTNTNVARILVAPPSAGPAGPKARVEGLLVPRPQNQPDTAKH